MTTEDLSVEEALDLVLEKAAMLQYLMQSVQVVGYVPEKTVMNGMGDVCSDIEDLGRQIKRTLDGPVLNCQLKREKRSRAK